MMDNNNTVTDITKGFFVILLAGFVLLAAVFPAAAQVSMIPEDFDWGVYLMNQQQNDGWDSWGSAPQSNYGYQDPFSYNWYGQTYTMDFYEPTPMPQYNFGSNDYVPAPSYPDPNMNQNNGYVETNLGSGTNNDDGWFYQLEPGTYDDFSNWNGEHVVIPESAFVSGFVGYEQSYNLDCEARSAVDLAAWFGTDIPHSEFLYYLPKSDDPNVGFVGSWTDARGHIPPASYGVYQEPVAELLRKYGVNAVGVYAYTPEALKGQIAQGKPVMVWVVGNVEIGYGVPYTPASTGHTTYVVPYQHTVVVTGYDEGSVYIQDGALRYTRDWNTFLLSWGVLGNRAIYVN